MNERRFTLRPGWLPAVSGLVLAAQGAAVLLCARSAGDIGAVAAEIVAWLMGSELVPTQIGIAPPRGGFGSMASRVAR